MSTRVALTDKWVNSGMAGDWSTVNPNNAAAVGWWPEYHHHYWPWYPYYVPLRITEPARPIRLAFSEVEMLRAVAAKDAALKAILAKFTHLIEVDVDL